MPDQLLLQIIACGPMTHQEIARTMGLRVRTVKEAEERALQKLRRAIRRDPQLRECLLDYLENEARPRQDFYEFIRKL